MGWAIHGPRVRRDDTHRSSGNVDRRPRHPVGSRVSGHLRRRKRGFRCCPSHDAARFFEKADYAAAMATIALPINLINALAPPVLAALMAGMGAHAVFAALGVLSATAFMVLWHSTARGLGAP